MNPEDDPAKLPTILAHDEIIPFDPDEFATAFAWGMNAAIGAAQVSNPAHRRLELIDEAGSVSELRFKDEPMDRLWQAMLERYGKVSYRKYFSAAFRIMGLWELIGAGKLGWRVHGVPGQPRRIEIATSVIEAAATVPFKKGYGFPLRAFMRKVHEIEAREAADSPAQGRGDSTAQPGARTRYPSAESKGHRPAGTLPIFTDDGEGKG